MSMALVLIFGIWSLGYFWPIFLIGHWDIFVTQTWVQEMREADTRCDA